MPQKATPAYPSLSQETRERVDTNTAAFHLSRAPKTLRSWADGGGKAPIRPRRINGRLAWSVAELRKLLQGEDA
jgi:hypothetical protein